MNAAVHLASNVGVQPACAALGIVRASFDRQRPALLLHLSGFEGFDDAFGGHLAESGRARCAGFARVIVTEGTTLFVDGIPGGVGDGEGERGESEEEEDASEQSGKPPQDDSR